jgi:hypothetical protein
MGNSKLLQVVPFPYRTPSIRLSKMNVGDPVFVRVLLFDSVPLHPTASYNPDQPVPSHFTQVVWKATTHVGCAVSMCKGLLEPTSGQNSTSTGNRLDGTYYVCLYYPPGNVVGEEK